MHGGVALTRIRHRPRSVVVLAATVAVVALPGSAYAAGGDPGPDSGAVEHEGRPFVPGELVVGFDAGVGRSARAATLADADAERKRALPLPRVDLVRLHGNDSVREAAATLQRRPGVRYAEPNFLYRIDATPDDPGFGQLWGLDNTGQTVNGSAGTADADIDAPEAWERTTGSPETTVAVVDTGVAYDHHDLAPNMWTNPGESGGGKQTNGVDDDGDGLVDDWRGWDWVGHDNDPRDLNGHGTHVAGTIGARGDNGQGVVGVNWQVGLMPLRACDQNGSCTNADVASAFAYAGARGAAVVNASLSGSGLSQAQSDAIDGAPHTLFVVAAGNGGSDGVGDDNDSAPQYPCALSQQNVVCVAATTQSDGLAGFSNYGAASVDLGAPGVNVYSTAPAYSHLLDEGFEGDIASTWSTGGTKNTWARTTESAGSGGYSLTDSPGANYLNNTDSYARTVNAVSLAGKKGCRIDYRLLISVVSVPSGDSLRVEASPDGSSWTELSRNQGSSGGAYFSYSDDLSALEGQPSVFVRFRLVTNGTSVSDGVHVDDVAVKCVSTTYSGDEYRFLSGTSMATPHVAGTAALLDSQQPGASPSAVKSVLLANTDPLPALAGKTVSGGRLNADIDFTPPDTQIDDGPTGTTNDPTPTFAFSSSEGGSSFKCRVDSASFASCTSPHTTAALGDGQHTFEVRATDPAGNTDPTPASRTFTVDAQPPAVPTIDDTDPDPPANDNHPSVKGSGAAASSTVKVYGDASCAGAPIGSGPATDFEGTTGIEVSVPDDETTELRATAADGGGESACSDPFPYVEDSTPPDTQIDSGPAEATNGPAPIFAFHSAEPGSSFECRVDSAPFASCTSPHTAAPLGDGEHTFEVRATDAAGNTDPTPASRTFTVDTVPPAEPTLDATVPASPANDNTPLIAGSAESTAQLYVTDCSGPPVASGEPAAFSDPGLEVTVPDDSTTTFRAKATDAAGNTSPCSGDSIQYVEDSTPPGTQIDSGPTGTTRDRTPSFAFSSEDPSASFECALDGGGFAPCGSPFTAPPLADGPHALRVRAIDAAGNSDTTPAQRTFAVDTAPPAAAADTDPPQTTITKAPERKTRSKRAQLEFLSDESGSSFECSLDGAAFSPCSSPDRVKARHRGRHSFEVRATDRAGNTDPTPDRATWKRKRRGSR